MTEASRVEELAYGNEWGGIGGLLEERGIVGVVAVKDEFLVAAEAAGEDIHGRAKLVPHRCN